MEKELISRNEQSKTIDSREVAEMMETSHDQILRKLDGAKDRKGIIAILADNHMVVSEYFIESSYKDGSGKENKCYLFTKMGCEFIANKFTGEKGILFTAKYVKKFNTMEEQLSNPVQDYLLMSEEDRAILYFTKAKEAKQLEADNKKKDELLLIAGEKTSLVDEFLLQTGTYSIDNFSKVLGVKELGTNNLHKYLRNNKIIMTDKYTYTDSKGKEKTGYGIKHFTAYAYYVESGYFKHNLVDYYVGKKIADTKQNKAVLTAKGVEWLYKKLMKDGYIAKKTLETVITELESKLVA